MTLIWSCYLSVGVSTASLQMELLHCISNSTEDEVDHLPRENAVIMKLIVWRVSNDALNHSIWKYCLCTPSVIVGGGSSFYGTLGELSKNNKEINT